MTRATIIEAEHVLEVPPTAEPSVSMGPAKVRANLNIEKALGTFQLDILFSRFFKLNQASIHFNYSAVVKAGENQTGNFGLAIINNGVTTARFGERKFAVNTGQAVFSYNPELEERHLFHGHQRTQVTYLDIDGDYLRNGFLNESFTGEHQLEKLKDQILRKQFVCLAGHTTSLQQKLLSDMNTCPLQGTLGNMMLESYLQQVLAIQFSQVCPQAPDEKLNSRDRDVIHAVKEYLHQTFTEDHTLLDLARQFGLNQNKLKKCFKEEFGAPVIEYLYNLKMDHARTMIFDRGMNVSEAASLVGYKHPHHFATAFKRRFGITPSSLKR